VRAGVEACDDGNLVNTDACLNSCVVARCGDAVVRSGVEECDDGNTSDTDACLNTCVTATCGDGAVRTGTEECDDGGSLDGDGCSALCEIQQKCGDATDDGIRSAVDALAILRSAVGLDTICPMWICDVNRSGRITATDSQAVLLRAVGGSAPLTCGQVSAIRFRVNSAVLFGSVSLAVDYSAAPGSIPLVGGQPDCTSLVPNLVTGVSETGPDRLSISAIKPTGVQGPATFVECKFVPTANVDPEDFVIEVLEALTPQNTEIEPAPPVVAIPY
jgi:cysteine-rich repeat protein